MTPRIVDAAEVQEHANGIGLASEVEAEWDEEIKRRLAEVDSGAAELIPAEEVFAEVRRILR